MLKVDGIERVIPASETIRRVAASAEALGLTRVADITGLDRIGIPVFTAVVPCSDDGLSVYNGKGARPIDARVGAIMEAIERQTALRTRLPYIEGSFAELSRKYSVIDPRSINQRLDAAYSETAVYCWVEGLNIVTHEPCWVPAKYAGYFWDDLPERSPFEGVDTNGLASGNCREEAICHALCELAERDSWTFAELLGHQLPRQRRLLVYGREARTGPDDFEACPCLDVGPNALMDKFLKADLHPVVRDITSRLAVPTVFASVADEHISGFPMAHSGSGSHPDVEVALRRALTELAQSRCVDIQGVREDLLPPSDSNERFGLHRRRVSVIDRNSWYLTPSERQRPLTEVRTQANATVDQDLEYLVESFCANGLDQIVVVDFTPEASNYSVVRVIVPGIEFWAADRGRLGPRALAFWKEHA